MGLIVDRSKSVGKANFITVKNALKSFVDNFNITPETTHVSFIFFAGEALHLFNLTDPKYQSNGAVKKAIDAVPDKLYWGTRTDLALMKAHDHLFERGQDRRKRPNVLVVLTDGKSSPNSAPYSETVPPLEVQLCECRLLVFRLIVNYCPQNPSSVVQMPRNGQSFFKKFWMALFTFSIRYASVDLLLLRIKISLEFIL